MEMYGSINNGTFMIHDLRNRVVYTQAVRTIPRARDCTTMTCGYLKSILRYLWDMGIDISSSSYHRQMKKDELCSLLYELFEENNLLI